MPVQAIRIRANPSGQRIPIAAVRNIGQLISQPQLPSAVRFAPDQPGARFLLPPVDVNAALVQDGAVAFGFVQLNPVAGDNQVYFVHIGGLALYRQVALDGSRTAHIQISLELGIALALQGSANLQIPGGGHLPLFIGGEDRSA
ncbi:hypothetical protein D3C73_572310 [compost metagenome]